jgi:hypothetical protein
VVAGGEDGFRGGERAVRKALFVVLGLTYLVITSSCSKESERKSVETIVVDGKEVYQISKEEDLEFVMRKGRLISTMLGHVEYVSWVVEGYNCDIGTVSGSIRVFFPRDDYIFARKMKSRILKHNEHLVRSSSGAASCNSIK